MKRRRPPDPGIRPRAGVRFLAGRCPICQQAFIIDRAVQPWARARTCSVTCAAHLANRGRNVLTCDHCVMVEGYTHVRQDQEIALENEHRHDENAYRRLITFRPWLQHYPWPSLESRPAA